MNSRERPKSTTSVSWFALASHKSVRKLVCSVSTDSGKCASSCFPEDLVGQGAEEGWLAGVIDDRRGRNIMVQKGREGRLKLHRIVPNLPAPAALLPRIELLGKLLFQRQRRGCSCGNELVMLRH